MSRNLEINTEKFDPTVVTDDVNSLWFRSRLTIIDCKLSFINLTHLNVAVCNQVKDEHLEGLVNLVSLNVNAVISDRGLMFVPYLCKIDLTDNEIITSHGLEQLRNLEEITMLDDRITLPKRVKVVHYWEYRGDGSNILELINLRTLFITSVKSKPLNMATIFNTLPYLERAAIGGVKLTLSNVRDSVSLIRNHFACWWYYDYQCYSEIGELARYFNWR